MNRTLSLALGLFLLVALTPPATAKSGRPEPPDPARGLIGVRIKVALLGKASGGWCESVYFIRIVNDTDRLAAEHVIASDWGKARNAYLLNAEPGRYAAVGCEFSLAGIAMRGVALFSKDDIAKTEIDVKAGAVAFMGEIDAGSPAKGFVLDEVQTHYMELILAASPKLAAGRPDVIGDFARAQLIRGVERGEAVDPEFWSEATQNHFRGEAAWINRIASRPVLRPQTQGATGKAGG